MDSYQAKLAKLYLNGCSIQNQQIKVNTSKSNYIIMPKKGVTADSEECMLAQDFSHSKEHRYKIAGSRNFQNIAPPSKVLHLSNLPKDALSLENHSNCKCVCCLIFNFGFYFYIVSNFLLTKISNIFL